MFTIRLIALKASRDEELKSLWGNLGKSRLRLEAEENETLLPTLSLSWELSQGFWVSRSHHPLPWKDLESPQSLVQRGWGKWSILTNLYHFLLPFWSPLMWPYGLSLLNFMHLFVLFLLLVDPYMGCLGIHIWQCLGVFPGQSSRVLVVLWIPCDAVDRTSCLILTVKHVSRPWVFLLGSYFASL